MEKEVEKQISSISLFNVVLSYILNQPTTLIFIKHIVKRKLQDFQGVHRETEQDNAKQPQNVSNTSKGKMEMECETKLRRQRNPQHPAAKEKQESKGASQKGGQGEPILHVNGEKDPGEVFFV